MNQKTFRLIKNIYKVSYWVIVLFIILSGIYILGSDYDFVLTYNIGRYVGYAAIFFFSLTILPGMLRRFGIKSKLFVTTLTALKRENGDVMFLLAFLHYSIIKLFPIIDTNVFPPVFLTFEVIGLIALWLTFPLFLTSNDKSVKLLKKNWKKLHYLVYIIVWFIFAHVALVKINLMTVYVGILASLETLSLIYYYFIKKFLKK